MKNLLLVLALVPTIAIGQENSNRTVASNRNQSYIKSIDNLTLDAAYILTNRAMLKASGLDKNVSIAILDASGNIFRLKR